MNNNRLPLANDNIFKNFLLFCFLECVFALNGQIVSKTALEINFFIKELLFIFQDFKSED